jgi:hypothetical protein
MNKTWLLQLAFIIAALAIALHGHLTFAATDHPAGTLISQGGAVWRISDDGTARQPFDSAERFLSNRFSFSNVVAANAGDMALPAGAMYPWGNGMLFNDSGTIYQVSGQVSGAQKHPFTSAAVFLGDGFSFSQVVNGNLAGLPLGTPIDSTADALLPGTFIRNPSGAISEIIDAGVTAFPNAGVFFSNGGSFSAAVPSNVQPTTVASYRVGSIVNDAGALWDITANGKVGFPSAACYANFGFTFPMAIAGSTQGITSTGTACGDNPNSDGIMMYQTENVTVDGATYAVSFISADLSTKKISVYTESADHADCITSCTVLPLSSFLSEDGSSAGTNGSYFCPVSYGSSCTGKTNSFYAKIIDSKTGTLINAGNEYGRTFPLLTFAADGTPTWYSEESQYESSGTHAAAGIGYFGLVENGAVSLQANLLDSKQASTPTTQGAIGLKSQTVYLVHVAGATVPEEANVLQAMGLDDALLLDGGGSTALMYNGSYKSGPGRDIPNAVTLREHN